MHKIAIKLKFSGKRGQLFHYTWLKTGEFSAILVQKAGEFGDKLD